MQPLNIDILVVHNNCADSICTIVMGDSVGFFISTKNLCNSLLHKLFSWFGLLCHSTIVSEQIITLFNFDTTSICVDGNTCA